MRFEQTRAIFTHKRFTHHLRFANSSDNTEIGAHTMHSMEAFCLCIRIGVFVFVEMDSTKSAIRSAVPYKCERVKSEHQRLK